jgi:RNA polymerase sigma factor (sigma-70 family)
VPSSISSKYSVVSQLPEVELVRGAQSGDSLSLGLLLQQHEAGMRAVALSILGYSADTEDAVQDATLTAVRRISELRDPAMAGPWLRAITRNRCLMQLRARREFPLAADLSLRSGEPTPEEVIDRHALRDWIWQSIEELSEPLRLVVILRYFSGISSYDQIAAICEIPVGTVRSRLSQARGKLAEALRATAVRAHADVGQLMRARRTEALEMLAAAERGKFGEFLSDRWAPEMEYITGRGVRGNRRRIFDAMDSDIAAGVRQRLVSSVASQDLTIWQMKIINPPGDPGHCPPGVIYLMSLRGDQVQRLRLFHPSRDVAQKFPDLGT